MTNKYIINGDATSEAECLRILLEEETHRKYIDRCFWKRKDGRLISVRKMTNKYLTECLDAIKIKIFIDKDYKIEV